MNRGSVLIACLFPVAALAQPSGSSDRYPVGAGPGEVRAPFCVTGGPTQVRVSAPVEPRGHSGRGGGIRMIPQVDLKSGAVLDASGTTVSTLAITGNFGTVTATLAPGCYSVVISASGVAPAGGSVEVRVGPPVPVAPTHAPALQRPTPGPAPAADDS